MKRLWTLTWKVLAVAVVTMIGNSVAGGILFAGVDLGWEVEPSPAVLLGTGFLATLLIAAALVAPAGRSALRGGRLFLALFLAIFGLNVLLLQIEGLVFLEQPASFFLRSGLSSTVQAVLLALMTTLLFGRGPAPRRQTPAAPSPTSATGWVGRFAIAAVCYAILYLAAGLMIVDFVQPFYETQDLSVGPWFIPFQLGRGALYAAFSLLLVRSQVGSRWRTATTMAFLFPLLAGVANLLAPNPLMPDWIRPFHMIEIAGSNFVYGLLVGFLFWNPRAGLIEEQAQGARSLEDPTPAGLPAGSAAV